MGKVNMEPYIAFALAISPGCHDTLQDMYNARERDCYDAAQKSDFLKDPAISSHGEDIRYFSIVALGVLNVYEHEDGQMKCLLRTANPNVYEMAEGVSAPVQTKPLAEELELLKLDFYSELSAIFILLTCLMIMNKSMGDNALSARCIAIHRVMQGRVKGHDIPTPTLH